MVPGSTRTSQAAKGDSGHCREMPLTSRGKVDRKAGLEAFAGPPPNDMTSLRNSNLGILNCLCGGHTAALSWAWAGFPSFVALLARSCWTESRGPARRHLASEVDPTERQSESPATLGPGIKPGGPDLR